MTGVEVNIMLRLLPLGMASLAHVFASCAPYASPCAELRRSDVVGLVRIDDVRHPRSHTTEAVGVLLRSFKGPLRAGASMEFYGGGVCYDAPGQQGATYVLYARRLPDGRYSTDCTRTHVVGERRRDIEFLERASSFPSLALLMEPFGCNEAKLPTLVHRLWIWGLTRIHPHEW